MPRTPSSISLLKLVEAGSDRAETVAIITELIWKANPTM